MTQISEQSKRHNELLTDLLAAAKAAPTPPIPTSPVTPPVPSAGPHPPVPVPVPGAANLPVPTGAAANAGLLAKAGGAFAAVGGAALAAAKVAGEAFLAFGTMVKNKFLSLVAAASPAALEQFNRALLELNALLGEPLLPIMRLVTRAVQQFTDWLAKTPTEARQLAAVLATVAAGVAAAGAALAALASPIGVIGAATAALVALFVELEQGRSLARDLWNGLKQLWGAFKDGFNQVWATAGPVLAKLREEWNRVFAALRAAWASVQTLLAQLFSGAGGILGDALIGIVRLGTAFAEGINSMIESAVYFANFTASLFNQIRAQGLDAFANMGQIVRGAMGAAAYEVRQFVRQREEFMKQAPPPAGGRPERVTQLTFQSAEDFWKKLQEQTAINDLSQRKENREQQQARDISDLKRGQDEANRMLGQLVTLSRPDPNEPARTGKG